MAPVERLVEPEQSVCLLADAFSSPSQPQKDGNWNTIRFCKAYESAISTRREWLPQTTVEEPQSIDAQ
jgi:hypothetical protein